MVRFSIFFYKQYFIWEKRKPQLRHFSTVVRIKVQNLILKTSLRNRFNSKILYLISYAYNHTPNLSRENNIWKCQNFVFFCNFAVTTLTYVALRKQEHFFILTMFCVICSLRINYDLHSYCFDVYTMEKVKLSSFIFPYFVLFDLFFLVCCCSRMEKIKLSMFWLTIFCLICTLTIINDNLF